MTEGVESHPLLQMRGISKAYPGVLANDDIDIDLRNGEIHAVLGENGAGKTTLMSILYGLVHPDAGTIALAGSPVRIRSPRDALSLGLGYVQQHFSLIPTLSVAQNVALAMSSDGRRLPVKAAARRIRELAAQLGLRIEPNALVGDLSLGMRQRAEVLKALARDAHVLILDEPGAALTPQESAELSKLLRRLAESGVGIFYISHKLKEVLELAHRVTVLRRGRVVARFESAAVTEHQLAVAMVGRVTPSPGASTRTPTSRGSRLEVVGLSINTNGSRVLDGVSFGVGAGEVVGLAGVEGSGQVELTDAIAGMREFEGDVRVDGQSLKGRSVDGWRSAGVAHVPGDRRGAGLVASLTIAESLALPYLRRPSVSRFGLIRNDVVAQEARVLMERFDIRAPGPDTLVSSLSGGNQQRVIIARELSQRPRLVVCCFPTLGLDLAATAAVQQEILAARDAGSAVVYASLDLDELLSVATRIVVLHAGRVSGELPADSATPERLGLLMGGVSGQ